LPAKSGEFGGAPNFHVMEPRDFYVVESLSSALDNRGHLVVPNNYHDFIIYGPYWPMPPGRYIIFPEIRVETPSESFGRLQICDNGVVKEDVPLRLGSALVTKLDAISGLEVRIKASGVPFVLEKIIIGHLPDRQYSLTSKRIADSEKYIRSLSSAKNENRKRKNDKSLNEETDFIYLTKIIHKDFDNDDIPSGYNEKRINHHLNSWLESRKAPKVVDVWADELVKNWDLIAQAGFDPAALTLTASNHPRLFAKYARDAGLLSAEAKLISEGLRYDNNKFDGTKNSSEWQFDLNKAQGGFVKLAALAGKAFITCPFSGRTLTSKHSILVPIDLTKQVAIFYKFKSIKTFYIIIAGFAGSKTYLYVPEDNLILRMMRPTFEWGPPEHIIDQFYKLAIPRAALLRQYLAADTKTCALSATMSNLGHFFWNECSGLYEAAASGYLNEIEFGCLYSGDFVNPFDLVSEFKKPSLLKCNTEAMLFERALSNRLFCVRFVAGEITDQLANRISEVAIKSLTPTERNRISEARSANHLLWVSLRNHNKIWLNQVDGAVELIEILHQKFAKVAIYIDGSPDCQSLADEIKSRLSEDILFYSGLNIPIWHTIAWAQAIDTYVCAIGSGLVFVTWLAGKRGIAHSETHHLDQMSFWGDVRIGAPLPLTPNKNEIMDQGSTAYCNYSIEPEVMIRLLKSLLIV
jgi:hypothetical protein